MACFEQTKAIDDQRPGAAQVGHQNITEDLRNPQNSSDIDMLAEARVPKARKPYMITKQREKWTEDEHKLFLEAMHLHGRAWRRIQEHIGTKTAVQIRSHAQKFFSKVIRESSGDSSNSSGAAAPAIQIPPPRPKRKSVHPYPCNMRSASGNLARELPRLEKPQLQMQQTLCEQVNGSPTSVVTASLIGSENFDSDTSTIDIEERCPTSSIATDEFAVQVPPTDAEEVKGSNTSKEVVCDTSEAPVLKLFGKRVVVNDSHQRPNLCNMQTVTEMELDASAETTTSGTGKFSSHGASEENTWNPWLTNMQQFMCYLPQGAVFFSYNDGSVPYPQLSNPKPVTSDQQHQQQPSEAEYKLTRREASLAESNTTSSSVPETTTQCSDYAESCTKANGDDDTIVPVAGFRKYVSPNSIHQRGFMPYKRCAAESKVQPQAPGEEADGEMTRLCL